jgi:D-galactarolactone cycloisomerase
LPTCRPPLAGAGGDGWLEVDINDNPLCDQFRAPVLDPSDGVVTLNGMAPDVASIEQYRTL